MRLSPAILRPRSSKQPSDSTPWHLWSRRRPSAVRLKALTSPPSPDSQDFPTVPGYPSTAVVRSPDQLSGKPQKFGFACRYSNYGVNISNFSGVPSLGINISGAQRDFSAQSRHHFCRHSGRCILEHGGPVGLGLRNQSLALP